jgi:hypothetical protein
MAATNKNKSGLGKVHQTPTVFDCNFLIEGKTLKPLIGVNGMDFIIHACVSAYINAFLEQSCRDDCWDRHRSEKIMHSNKNRLFKHLCKIQKEYDVSKLLEILIPILIHYCEHPYINNVYCLKLLHWLEETGMVSFELVDEYSLINKKRDTSHNLTNPEILLNIDCELDNLVKNIDKLLDYGEDTDNSLFNERIMLICLGIFNLLFLYDYTDIGKEVENRENYLNILIQAKELSIEIVYIQENFKEDYSTDFWEKVLELGNLVEQLPHKNK